jgi:lysophospholipase L1-like esterase
MSLALKLVLAPVLVAQALATRKRAPLLPEAAGPRQGRVGDGDDPLHILIAGDSSAAGVGVAHQDQALAGHLTRALHRRSGRAVHWTLHARSGFTTQQVHALLRTHLPQARLAAEAAAPAPRFDTAVVVTGVNDVIDLVPPQRAVRHRAELADWLLGHAGAAHVLFAPLPPVHRFPLLPQPLRRVMGDDARRHDDAMARWAATRCDVSHIAIDLELGAEAMADDGFHPGEPVYRACGDALAACIAKLNPKETSP